MTAATPPRSLGSDAIPELVPIKGSFSVSNRSRDAVLALFLFALVALSYANALQNGFVLDDRAIVLNHPLVVAPQESWRAFIEPYWPSEVGGGQYRPLGILSFAVDRLVAGESAAWYHAVNVAWHLVVVCLLWLWLRGILPLLVATFAAAIFAVHPVHVEAVANVVGRLELMAGAFMLAALLAHQRKSWMAPFFYMCALFSKEHAVIFVAVALLGHVFAQQSRRAIVERSGLWASYAVVTAVWLLLMATAVSGHTTVISAVLRGLTVPDRLLTVLSIVPEYVRLMLFPLHLSADYEPAVLVAARSVNPRVILGLVIIAVCTVVAVRTWSKDRIIAFTVTLFAVCIAPVSNIFFPTGVAVAERTLYFPSIAACVLVSHLILTYGKRRLAMTFAASLVLATSLVRTWTRVPVWHDSRSYAITLLEEHPESYRGRWVAARVLWSMGDLPAAQREFGLARTIYPTDARLNAEAVRLEETMRSHSTTPGDGLPDNKVGAK